jgi:hypothetical protein
MICVSQFKWEILVVKRLRAARFIINSQARGLRPRWRHLPQAGVVPSRRTNKKPRKEEKRGSKLPDPGDRVSGKPTEQQSGALLFSLCSESVVHEHVSVR